jgi:CRP-like cAMP-binding protein
MVSSASPAFSRNQLLSALSADDLALLIPRLERVPLEMSDLLERPNEPIEHVYFPESGIASVIGIDGRKRRIEAGPFGREGMSGTPLVMGTDRSPHETAVQIGGTAQRISADDLRRALERSPALNRYLLLYCQAFSVQTTHTAVANAHAALEPRLARWLLMTQDRSDGGDLPLTHAFIALMLGVRRAGVTVAIQALEGRALIRAHRRLIRIVDREGLQEIADGSYGPSEAEYERLLGVPLVRKQPRSAAV